MTRSEKPVIAVLGGCSRVGLPFGVALACAGFETRLVDDDDAALALVDAGTFPFLETNGEIYLRAVLKTGLLRASKGPVDSADVIVITASTAVDEHLNPSLTGLTAVIEQNRVALSSASLVIFRGTLSPGTMTFLRSRLSGPKLAYCPERVAQGNALEEIGSFPQIVGAESEEDFRAAAAIVSRVSPAVIRLTPIEAEIMNLMHNAWRYLQFAIGNQFYMIAEQNGVDFHKLYRAILHDYPRASGYARPGLTAGPSLFNDTMQLASFFEHQFYLGHAAMLVNEGLADLLVQKAKQALGGELWGKSVAVLGLAFKPGSDDFRNSLSFRIKKGLEFGGAEALCHDPRDPRSAPLEDILAQADAAVLATPHQEYRELEFSRPLIDVWDFYGRASIDVLPGRGK